MYTCMQHINTYFGMFDSGGGEQTQSHHAEGSADVYLHSNPARGPADVQLPSSWRHSPERAFLQSACDTDRSCQLDSQDVSALLIYSSPFGISLKTEFLYVTISEPWSCWQDMNNSTGVQR